MPAPPPPIRIVWSDDGSDYLAWQSWLLARTARLAGFAGPLTRLVASAAPVAPLGYGEETVVTPPRGTIDGDFYPPYNKPHALAAWLERAGAADETLLVLDPDMVVLRPPEEGAAEGAPSGEYVDYMDPARQPELVARHGRRNPHLVRPIGVPLVVHARDLAAFAGRWAELTRQIRADPASRAAVGWVAEMWACAIAAAESGLDVRPDARAQHPGDPLSGRPYIHYSFDSEAAGWRWGKRDYRPWTPIPRPPAEAPATARLLWAILDDAGRAARGEPPPAPGPEPAPAPRAFARCPGGVCRHGHGDRCKAVVTGHWRYCELTDPGHPDYDARYLPGLAPAAGPPPPPPPPPPPTSAADRAAVRRIQGCRHRAASCRCEGRPAKCRKKHGDPVSWADCLACVAAGGDRDSAAT